MGNANPLKWVTGILELILGIPVLGGLIVLGFSYTPLGIMFVLHLVTLLICYKENQSFYGSAFGILTSLLAWIPVVGMVMHLISAGWILASVLSGPRSRRSW